MLQVYLGFSNLRVEFRLLRELVVHEVAIASGICLAPMSLGEAYL